ncbi:Uncharacterised protein [Kluyvera cryocrescens]|nr:Uncharacterised protein [Kluyvera cryocrescens]
MTREQIIQYQAESVMRAKLSPVANIAKPNNLRRKPPNERSIFAVCT